MFFDINILFWNVTTTISFKSTNKSIQRRIRIREIKIQERFSLTFVNLFNVVILNRNVFAIVVFVFFVVLIYFDVLIWFVIFVVFVVFVVFINKW